MAEQESELHITSPKPMLYICLENKNISLKNNIIKIKRKKMLSAL